MVLLIVLKIQLFKKLCIVKMIESFIKKLSGLVTIHKCRSISRLKGSKTSKFKLLILHLTILFYNKDDKETLSYRTRGAESNNNLEKMMSKNKV